MLETRKESMTNWFVFISCKFLKTNNFWNSLNYNSSLRIKFVWNQSRTEEFSGSRDSPYKISSRRMTFQNRVVSALRVFTVYCLFVVLCFFYCWCYLWKTILCSKYNFGFTQLYTWESIAWTVLFIFSFGLIVLLPKLDVLPYEKCGKSKTSEKKDHINIAIVQRKGLFPIQMPFFSFLPYILRIRNCKPSS